MSITAALSVTAIPDRVMSTILEQCIEALQAFGGIIGLLSPRGDAVEIHRAQGYPAEVIAEYRRQSLTAGTAFTEAVRQAQPIWIESREAIDAGAPVLAPIARLTGAQAQAVIPLCVRERVLGALLLSFSNPRVFSPEDRSFLTAVAQQCAQALEHARLYNAERLARDAAEEAVLRVTSLQALTAALSDARTRRDVATVVLQQAVPLFGASAGAIGAYGEASNTLSLLASVGYSDEFMATRHSYPASEHTLGGRAVLSHAPEFIESIDDMPGAPPELVERFRTAGFMAAAAAPLTHEAHVLGFLVFNYRHRQTFLPEERALLSAFASQCTHALLRIELYEAEQAAREAAETALRQRDTFLTAAAHELKTPLTSLRGFAQLITRRLDRGEELDLGELHGALDVIVRQTVKLNALVDQLLDVTRLESGTLPLHRTNVDLVQIVRDVVGSLGARRRSITLHGPEELTLLADGPRLAQVVTNLVSNAVKYSPLGEAVEIDIERTATHAVVKVRDHGPGIPPRLMDQLFQPYASMDPADRLHGLGLGLHVSREIVTRHGGLLTADTPLDGGALLVLRLPLSDG